MAERMASRPTLCLRSCLPRHQRAVCLGQRRSLGSRWFGYPSEEILRVGTRGSSSTPRPGRPSNPIRSGCSTGEEVAFDNTVFLKDGVNRDVRVSLRPPPERWRTDLRLRGSRAPTSPREEPPNGRCGESSHC